MNGRRKNHGSIRRLSIQIRVTSSRNMPENLSEAIRRVVAREAQSDETDVRAATAPYQADFPYERDEEAHVTRREFCNFLGLTSAALFLGTGGFAAKAALDARNTESLAPVRVAGAETLAPNSALNFKIGRASCR